MNCEQIRAVKTPTGLRYVPCRICLPCRLTRQYDWANRLQWEIAREGFDRSWFFTGTITREAMAEHFMSDPVPAGELAPGRWVMRLNKETQKKQKTYLPSRQEKLMTKLQDNRYRTAKESERAHRVINEMLEENPSRPTVKRAEIQKWKKRVRERIGFLPRMLPVMEYGTRTNRPHAHCVIIGCNEKEAQATVDSWGFSKDYKEVEPVQSEKIGSYISKDIVKGTWSNEAYIANGRESPFMLWPIKPCLAAGQEEEIYQTLKLLQDTTVPYDFEHRVQIQHIGKFFETKIDGKTKTRVNYGKTAYKKALARIERDEETKAMLTQEAYSQAEFRVTHTDPGHPHYLESHGEHHAKKQAEAKRRSERAQRRHRELLHRKGYRT